MKKKILHVIGGMGRGGAPIFIVNNLKLIDDNKLQFDFLVRKDNCAYNDIIKDHGGKVFVVPAFPRHLISNFIQTFTFFSRHASEYEAIHVHANALYYILPLVLGKIFGIKKRILHSHNTQSNLGIMQPLHYFNRIFVNKLANIFLACGKEAGKWMYQNNPFEVINNAVDVSKFKYSKSSRVEVRNEFGIPDDTFVIGNVGRFETAKNHNFIVDIFYNYHTNNPKSVLLLVGKGSLFDATRQKVDELGISSSVIFAGLRADIEKLYSAFDLFFLPSLFEGLPFVLVEAQCSGVNCLVSKSVTKEAYITDLVESLDLSDDVSIWTKVIVDAENNKKNREDYADIIRDMHYDIEYTASRLTCIYLDNKL